MNIARMSCLVGGIALYAANAAVVVIDDFTTGADGISISLPGFPNPGNPDTGAAYSTAPAVVPGGFRTIAMYASTAKGTPQNQANIGVGGGNMSIGTDGAVNANGFDPAWAPPPITDVIPPEPIPMPSCPCYTLRYDGDGPGMDMAWTWGQLGIVDVTFNDLGFLLAIWLEDTSGNKSTVSWLNVAKETYGDFMLPVVAGAADLNHIASINIDIDPNFGGDIVFGGVAVPEPSNAALAIGGLCFVGFLGRRFLKK